MEDDDLPAKSDAPSRERTAEALLAAMLEKAGWHVRSKPSSGAGRNLVARRKGMEYAVEIKAAPEGRADRIVPLFAQAVLESSRVADQKAAPLAVVAAPRISPRAAEQVMQFAERSHRKWAQA
jgi:hypothetical protein